MKNIVFIALISTLFLASCGLSKTQEAEIVDNVVELPVVETEISEEVEDNAMMEDDAMMDAKLENTETMMKEDSVEVMEKMEEEEAMMKKEDESVEVETMEKVELAGNYSEYSDDMIGKTENTVIFFHAAWCPSCRAADGAISAEAIPDGLTILKADFDSETELRKKYGVVGQHTFVQVDADGNEVKKWLGGNSVEDIVERLQ